MVRIAICLPNIFKKKSQKIGHIFGPYWYKGNLEILVKSFRQKKSKENI